MQGILTFLLPVDVTWLSTSGCSLKIQQQLSAALLWLSFRYGYHVPREWKIIHDDWCNPTSRKDLKLVDAPIPLPVHHRLQPIHMTRRGLSYGTLLLLERFQSVMVGYCGNPDDTTGTFTQFTNLSGKHYPYSSSATSNLRLPLPVSLEENASVTQISEFFRRLQSQWISINALVGVPARVGLNYWVCMWDNGSPAMLKVDLKSFV